MVNLDVMTAGFQISLSPIPAIGKSGFDMWNLILHMLILSGYKGAWLLFPRSVSFHDLDLYGDAGN